VGDAVVVVVVEGVAVPVGVWLLVELGVRVGDGVLVADAEGVPVDDTEGVGVCVGVPVAEWEVLGVGVLVEVPEGVAVMEAVGVAVRVVVVEGVAVNVVVVEGVGVLEGVRVGVGVFVAVIDGVGVLDGVIEGVGVPVPVGVGDGCVSDNTTLVSCHEAPTVVTTVAHTDMVPNPAEGAVQENVIDVLSALLLWVTWLLHDEDARELVPADRLPKNEVEVVRVLPRTTAAENPRKVPPLSVTVYVCPDSHEVTTWLDPSRTVSTNDVVDVWEVPCPGWVVQESRPAERE
jgi:hypothetical protein